MKLSNSETGLRRLVPVQSTMFWPAVAFLLFAIIQFDVASHRAINWDEFFHFSQIHLFAQGKLVQPLQTLHARAFAWVIAFPGNAIDHLIWIRMFSVAATLGTAACIYGIARHFADRESAAICALLYLSAGFVLQHGSSFRADPFLAFLLMAALLILVRSPLTWFACAGAGLLCAIASMESIKSVLFAPAFAGVAMMRWMEDEFSWQTLLRLALVGLFTGAFFLLLYVWHSAGLGNESGQVAQSVIRSSSKKMFALGGLPYYPVILQAALYAIIFTVLIVIAPVLIWRNPAPLARQIALAGFWLPITVLAFYHNTAPYFYVFILPPLAVACVFAVQTATRRYHVTAMVGMLVLSAVIMWSREDRSVLANQAVVVDAADHIFRQPVAYFDTSAMLGTYPKANHFMTPWGQDGYLRRHMGSFSKTMEHTTVPLVIEIEPIFTQALRSDEPSNQLLPEDRAALRANFVHFWGPYWLAGKNLRQGTHAENFLVPGQYTVELGQIEIDGTRFAAGDVITLSRGEHVLTAETPAGARLVWGNRLQRPRGAAPSQIWATF